ncbi:MAG: hypothetical protein MJ237_07385 [bacterium]|nr:hypothetical protein [bacterium]
MPSNFSIGGTAGIQNYISNSQIFAGLTAKSSLNKDYYDYNTTAQGDFTKGNNYTNIQGKGKVSVPLNNKWSISGVGKLNYSKGVGNEKIVSSTTTPKYELRRLVQHDTSAYGGAGHIYSDVPNNYPTFYNLSSYCYNESQGMGDMIYPAYFGQYNPNYDLGIGVEVESHIDNGVCYIHTNSYAQFQDEIISGSGIDGQYNLLSSDDINKAYGTSSKKIEVEQITAYDGSGGLSATYQNKNFELTAGLEAGCQVNVSKVIASQQDIAGQLFKDNNVNVDDRDIYRIEMFSAEDIYTVGAENVYAKVTDYYLVDPNSVSVIKEDKTTILYNSSVQEKEWYAAPTISVEYKIPSKKKKGNWSIFGNAEAKIPLAYSIDNPEAYPWKPKSIGLNANVGINYNF